MGFSRIDAFAAAHSAGGRHRDAAHLQQFRWWPASRVPPKVYVDSRGHVRWCFARPPLYGCNNSSLSRFPLALHPFSNTPVRSHSSQCRGIRELPGCFKVPRERGGWELGPFWFLDHSSCGVLLTVDTELRFGVPMPHDRCKIFPKLQAVMICWRAAPIQAPKQLVSHCSSAEAREHRT